MKPMNILLAADHLKFGGGERHTVALATGLAARGHNVAVAYLKQSEELADELRRGGVQQLHCCQSKGGLNRAALRRMAAIIAQHQADVVVATSHYSLMYAALARLITGGQWRLSFIAHGMEVVRRGHYQRLRWLVYRQFYRCAAPVVFVSELQRQFFAALGIAPARTEVVHSGIDLARFDLDAVAVQGRQLRQQYGIGDEELVVGLCAVFREEKRQVDLIEAVGRLVAAGVPARAVLVGDGSLRPQIEARIASLGLQDKVILAGFQQDVRPWIAMCDVMALTSHAEAFPIATLEYMALGKPIVASNVGGLPEQIEHGLNGLLYPAGDVAALTAALQRLADPALCRKLGQGALQAAHQRFDVRQMIQRYELIFAGP